ncbi:MAG TPA: hypothetical protein VGR21_03980, partial [Cryptosporangiaceae bacterium]|nr:hypothetical protein [Cryptosporangiaceae bacterium]
CDFHPEGVDAHVDRHLALRRAGWYVVEALPSRWSERQHRLVVELATWSRSADSTASPHGVLGALTRPVQPAGGNGI